MPRNVQEGIEKKRRHNESSDDENSDGSTGSVYFYINF